MNADEQTNADVSAETLAGQAVYTRRTLKLYDFLVLGLSNRLAWKCPTSALRAHYDSHITTNHLDVGVGTGYFLDRCVFPDEEPRIALMDLNQTALHYAAERIERYQPEMYQRNVLKPIPFDGTKFDSVGINFLLHCLPGDMTAKSVVFDHLANLMNPDAVLFGSTLLQGDQPRNWLARRIMKTYNRKGIFSNENDDLATLKTALEKRFQKVTIETNGCAALFVGRLL